VRQELAKIDQRDHLAIGTATDPYQPAERRFERTRAISRSSRAKRNWHLGITTKSDLILRDVRLLKEIARRNVLGVNITITTTDEKLARLLEPRAPRVELRLETVRRLARGRNLRGGISEPRDAGDQRLGGIARLRWRRPPRKRGPCLSEEGPLPAGSGAGGVPAFLDAEFPQLASRYRETFERGVHLSRRYKDALAEKVRRIRARYQLTSGMMEYRPELWVDQEQMALFPLNLKSHEPGRFRLHLPDDLIAQQALATAQPRECWWCTVRRKGGRIAGFVNCPRFCAREIAWS
jgi:hypothetical protein